MCRKSEYQTQTVAVCVPVDDVRVQKDLPTAHMNFADCMILRLVIVANASIQIT